MEFKVGQTIETNAGRQGTVKYVGGIHVAEGLWLGIELPTPSGKNDGSVRGERYFQCSPLHGLFAKASDIVRIVSQPVAKPPTPKPAPVAKPSSPVKSSSPAKPPAKRQSLVAAAAKPRPSSVGAAKPPPKPAAPSKRMSVAPQATSASVKGPSRRTSVAASTSSSSSTPSRSVSTSTRPAAPSATSSSTARATRDPNTDALETRIRHLEKQHTEDRELLKELDQAKTDRDRFESLLKKLQDKIQSFHQENTDLKGKLKNVEAEHDRLSKAEQQFDTDLELAFLDKEMAEERAEQAEAEIETIRERMNERELELEILRSEAELYGSDMSEEDKQAAGFYRIEKERDRLKEALLMLKDITEQTEYEQRMRIQELETDLTQFDQLRQDFADLQDKCITAEATVEDLRQRLDAANEAEDMVEELSGQNQELKEQLAEKDMAIKDLESLKELNDELEIQHIEQANELRAELEARDAELAEQQQRNMQQDSTIANQEGLITKFRDLVVDLQSKMTDAESSKIMSEAQAKDVTGRFNEVMDLNRRLRTANTTATAKAIASEIQKLQADEAQEELSIVKQYLPDSPEMHSNDALRAYFLSKRISFKSSLLSSLMKSLDLQISGDQEGEQPSAHLLRLDVVYQLTSLHLKGEQFWPAIASSSLEQFSLFGPAYTELLPVEKTLERGLDALKKDEVNFKDFADSLRRSNHILQGVTLDHKDILASHPENETIYRISSIKSSYDYIRASFDALKASVSALDLEDQEEEEEDGLQVILQKLSKPSDSCSESIVSADKLLRTLNTLREDSLYPQFPQGLDDIIQQDNILIDASRKTAKFSMDFTKHILPNLKENEEEERIPPSELVKPLTDLMDMNFPANEIQGITHITTKLNSWNEQASVLMNNVEIEHGPAPWVAKAKEVEAAKRRAAEAETKLHTLTAEHHATVLQIREREEVIDTKELEIEHLRAKHQEASKKVDDLSRLQAELKTVERERQRFHQELRAQQIEIQRLKDRAMSERSDPVEAAPVTPSGGTQPVPEKAGPQQPPTGNFATFVQALSQENHWLRRRKKADVFDQECKAMFSNMRQDQAAEAKKELRHKQRMADEMLAMAMDMDLCDGTGMTDVMPVSQPHGKSTRQHEQRQKRKTRHAPVKLARLKAPLGWRPFSAMPDCLEDVSFAGLSPAMEAFEGGLDESSVAGLVLGDEGEEQL